MSVNIRLLSKRDELKWDLFAERDANSTVFHKIGWMRAIEKTYGHKPYYLLCEDESGEITGILPLFFIKSMIFGKRLVSLPFAPYGGICSDDDEAKRSLVGEAIRLSERLGADYCEIRSVNDNDLYDGFSHDAKYADFTIDLSNGIEPIWYSISHSRRKLIKKGERNDLKFEMGATRDLIDEFYDVYSWSMKYFGTPVHSQSLFINLFDEFKDDILISKLKMRDEIIAAEFLAKFKCGIVSLWGTYVRDYLRFGASDFNNWKILEYGYMNNYLWYNIGRSPMNTSHYTYKKHWRFVDTPIFNHYYPSTVSVSMPQEKYAAISNIWKRLPLDTTKIIGPAIRKYII